MYHDFFGFTQVPFSIAPDPEFLFLGPRHREGLAHLRNGLTGSGGFLLLTGEVGTGKTTLSRAILAELGDTLDVAFVLNPMLSERELLATICDQFGIPGRHEKASLKRLTDHLSRFLQEAGEQGRNPVVLIDEAQHLLPSVLEQLRLLTNLETDSRKLLSVVLIGQPELQELLQRRELRQVAQRIVARYHLLPLTFAETKDYIQHRLARVEANENIFNTAALKAVWQFSQGTPRLINLVCDRALQIAAREELQQVTGKHVAEAVASLSFAPAVQRAPHARRVRLSGYIGVTAILVIVIGALSWAISEYLPLSSDNNQANTQASHDSKPNRPLDIGSGMLLLPAVEALAERWDVASFAIGSEPCQQLRDVNLACLRTNFSMPELIQFDTPVLFKGAAANQAQAQQREAGYYLLLGYGSAANLGNADNEESHAWIVWDGEALHYLSDIQFAEIYSGNALLLWQIPTSDDLTDVVRGGLAERVPYSMQNRSLLQQLQWLRQSQAVRINEMSVEAPAANELSAIELAVLSSAHYQQRPRLSDANLNVAGIRTTAEPRVSYLGGAETLEQLIIPQERLLVPEEFSNNPIVANTVANEADEDNRNSNEGERLTTRQVNVSEEDDLDDVSPRIRALFDQAVAEVGINDVLSDPSVNNTQTLRELNELTAAERRSLPRFEYNSHMYSGRTQERWIRLNDRMLREGDRLGDLRVIQIEAAHTIFGFREILFRVEALEDLTD
ncbi:hypothetical protein CWE13_12180 [Aliidiomarina shirensis]|uniref:AAA+ ATPase domain-containing protein n=1 Tax=Aliidiomarina shirensis TaxID=1048642 RepID=A0A432WKU9_9GAMM|nr:AAA family ATPase [Aliidiomarina shirensis]RUO34378.1 hypothetical protein CWE13_12180 [Aliidiomarina shirensis]